MNGTPLNPYRLAPRFTRSGQAEQFADMAMIANTEGRTVYARTDGMVTYAFTPSGDVREVETYVFTKRTR